MNLIGRKIIRYQLVTSTNDLVREWSELGEAEGLVVTADEQTQGRGRLGRKWIAPPGSSLQLSILLRPPLAPTQAHRLTQMAALALAATLREFVPGAGESGEAGQVGATASPSLPPPPMTAVALKWPNDVLLNGKKCAGILVETAVEGHELKAAIIGLGLNVNFAMRQYPDLAPFATTLADELGHAVDRQVLERTLLGNLDAYYVRLRAGEDFFEEWRGQLRMLGQTVRVATPSGIAQGIAENVAADGALLLRQGEQLLELYAGDVTLLKG